MRWLRRTAIVVAGVAVAAAVRRHGAPFSRYAVEGPSMRPAYLPDDRVLVWRWAYMAGRPRTGDVVVLRDPQRDGHLLLKRIAKAPDGVRPGPSGVYVLGDNAAESRDSRAFGPVGRGSIVGKALLTY